MIKRLPFYISGVFLLLTASLVYLNWQTSDYNSREMALLGLIEHYEHEFEPGKLCSSQFLQKTYAYNLLITRRAKELDLDGLLPYIWEPASCLQDERFNEL